MNVLKAYTILHVTLFYYSIHKSRLKYEIENDVHKVSLKNKAYKKLGYCCDSRSYCMQYFNAIHCEHNISTSE